MRGEGVEFEANRVRTTADFLGESRTLVRRGGYRGRDALRRVGLAAGAETERKADLIGE